MTHTVPASFMASFVVDWNIIIERVLKYFRGIEKDYGFLKLSDFPLHWPFCLQVNKQEGLPRSMGFRLSNFSFVLLGRETFPMRFELYRVPVSTHLRRESISCDSWFLGYSKSMSRIILYPAGLMSDWCLMFEHIFLPIFSVLIITRYCLIESMVGTSSI